MMTFTRRGQPVVELKAVRGSVKPITTEALDWLAERRAKCVLRGTICADDAGSSISRIVMKDH